MSITGDAANRSSRSSSPRTPPVVENGGKRFHRGPLVNSIEPFVFHEIREIFTVVGHEQCFGRRALGEDDFVGFELDVEVFDDFTVVHLGLIDRSPAIQPE